MSEENINIARVGGTQVASPLPVTAVVTSTTLPTNAAQETGGNLATIAAKDFATSAKQDTINTSLATLDTDLKAAQPRKMQDGSGVALTSTGSALDVNLKSGALLAGSALIGKVGIDQTTPGTTNGVQVNAALPAGTNVIGHVIADSGSTTAVTGTVAVQGSVAVGATDSANPLTIAANDATGLVDTLDCESRDGQTQLLTGDRDVLRILEQLLYEQRLGNMLLVKLAEPYASGGWPSVTDPKTGVIQ